MKPHPNPKHKASRDASFGGEAIRRELLLREVRRSVLKWSRIDFEGLHHADRALLLNQSGSLIMHAMIGRLDSPSPPSRSAKSSPLMSLIARFPEERGHDQDVYGEVTTDLTSSFWFQGWWPPLCFAIAWRVLG